MEKGVARDRGWKHWEGLYGRVIDGAIDAVGDVLSIVVVVVRHPTLGPCVLVAGSLGAGILVARKAGRRGGH
ncbi:MAG: hypothetical protein NVSMB65_01010 [Chloroflexota bacterium]